MAAWNGLWFCKRRLALGAAVLVLGCHGLEAGRAQTPAATPASLPSALGSVGQVPVFLAPALAPVAIVNQVAGQFEVQARQPVALSLQAEIEAQSADGQWAAVSDLDAGKGYQLLESCSLPAPPSCRTLAAGARLNLAAWTGASCSAQCAEACPVDRFHPGVHRLVLHACDAPNQRYEGPPFEMAASARELWRWRAAADVQRGEVFRLDPHFPATDREAAPPEYIAGFRVQTDSGSPLSRELIDDFSAWLRSRDGFVQYDASKRCVQEHLVGFLLRVATPQGEEHTAEVALNFACNSAFITINDGRGRTTWVSHFDPSWDRIIAIVRRALPLDAELAGLRESPTHLPASFNEPSH